VPDGSGAVVEVVGAASGAFAGERAAICVEAFATTADGVGFCCGAGRSATVLRAMIKASVRPESIAMGSSGLFGRYHALPRVGLPLWPVAELMDAGRVGGAVPGAVGTPVSSRLTIGLNDGAGCASAIGLNDEVDCALAIGLIDGVDCALALGLIDGVGPPLTIGGAIGLDWAEDPNVGLTLAAARGGCWRPDIGPAGAAAVSSVRCAD